MVRKRIHRWYSIPPATYTVRRSMEDLPATVQHSSCHLPAVLGRLRVCLRLPEERRWAIIRGRVCSIIQEISTARLEGEQRETDLCLNFLPAHRDGQRRYFTPLQQSQTASLPLGWSSQNR